MAATGMLTGVRVLAVAAARTLPAAACGVVRAMSSGAAGAAGGEKPPLFLTDAAEKRIEQLRHIRKDPALALRVTVESGGCSGYQYAFSVESLRKQSPFSEASTSTADRDHVVNNKLVTDQLSLLLMRGSTIDYFDDGITANFLVKGNAKAAKSCSCGSSFSAAGGEPPLPLTPPKGKLPLPPPADEDIPA